MVEREITKIIKIYKVAGYLFILFILLIVLMLLWLTYYNPMACWSRGAAPQGELGNDAMCAPEIERDLCADNIGGI